MQNSILKVLLLTTFRLLPTGIYLFKVNKEHTTRRIGKTCSKLTIKATERRHLLRDIPAGLSPLKQTWIFDGFNRPAQFQLFLQISNGSI